MLECRTEIKVEWGHCDPARIVYNPNFFDWMERGLTNLLAVAGFELGDLVAADPDFRGTPLVKSESVFLAPAALGEIVTVVTRATRLGRSSLDVSHDFYLGDQKIIEATQTRVWSAFDSETGRMTGRAIPDDVRAALTEDRTVSLRLTQD